MKKTTIYIVRHGQSIGNELGLYLGRTDMELTEKGRQQAQYAADYLKDIEFDAIYSSPLMRAHNTAVPHALIRGMQVVDREELAEIFIGDWEGVPTDDLKKKYHDEYYNGWTDNYFTFTCPGGESVAACGERFRQGLERIAKDHEGKTVLVVAHGGVIRAFWGKMIGVDPATGAKEVLFPSNASYSVVTYGDEGFAPVIYSCDDHIPADEKTFIS